MTMATAASRARRTRIVIREFVCQSPEAHRQTMAVKSAMEITVHQRSPQDAQFKPLSGAHAGRWWPLPLCHCGFLADEQELYNPSMVQVPKSERAMFWLSPDGTKLSVPGRNDAPMPERYRRAGYIQVEATKMEDFDRFDSIRSKMTGNEAASEMNYDSATREYRREATPDFDSEEAMKSEI